MKQWLIENKGRLSFRSIEKEIGIPSTTLSKVVNGHMDLPKKWVEPLKKLAKNICESSNHLENNNT